MIPVCDMSLFRVLEKLQTKCDRNERGGLTLGGYADIANLGKQAPGRSGGQVNAATQVEIQFILVFGNVLVQNTGDQARAFQL